MSRRGLVLGSISLLLTLALTRVPGPAPVLWPPVAALTVILITRRALVGLLAGGLAGALLLAGGNPLAATASVFIDHLLPSLRSTWKLGAIAFTLLLGGFAAVLEAGGGFARLLERAAVLATSTVLED